MGGFPTLSYPSHIGLIKGSPHSLLPASGCPFMRLIYDILGLGIVRRAPCFKKVKFYL